MILGAGESGIGAAALAQHLGYTIWVSDGGSIKPKYREKLQAWGIAFEESNHNLEQILQADLVVKSPGIPGHVPVMQAIINKGIEVVSEIEFAYRHCPGKIVAITGSNGKTTTSLLTHHILKNAGFSVTLAGNVGNSFAMALATQPTDYYVLEVSSFQLDDIVYFKPHIAILTNITPDHLDRYNYQVDEYAAAKLRICENQDSNDFFIWNYDDALSKKYLSQTKNKAQAYALSINTALQEGAWLNDKEQITIKIKTQEAMKINELALQGKHNTYNGMASGLASKLLGIRKETIRESLAGFESIEHRLEPVLSIYGIQYINDSKATNVNSTWYALDSMPDDIIWIAGGVDKGNDYSELFELVQEKVKAIVCLGVDNSKLHNEFDDKVEMVVDAANMDEAVRMAHKLATKGNSVLLSPACASFDLFENYEDRGRQFKQAVRQL